MALSEEKREKIRNAALMYYSRPEIQEAMFAFSQNREISPRYFDSFGKRPDSFQYKGDIFEMVKKGATSFHCSEEIWSNPLEVSTDKKQEQLNSLRIGWDLLLDIDCKWFDYSKKAAMAILSVLEDYGVTNVGIKFSGSKGFHIIIPWKSFPKELNGMKTSDLFPELPRKIIGFIRMESQKRLSSILEDEKDFFEQFKDTKIKKGIKCGTCDQIAREYYLVKFRCDGVKCRRIEEKKISPDEIENIKPIKCPECRGFLVPAEQKTLVYECPSCRINSRKNPENFSRHVEIDLFDLMGLDIILVSPRHLFRMPYSLHEKTALSSMVLEKSELENFDMKDADPFKIKIRNFIPESEEGEALRLLTSALEWSKESGQEEESVERKETDFSPVKLENLSESFFPPSIQKILKGLDDGRKRALFILLNFFRAIGMERIELEKRIYDWNKKNKIPMKEGYVKSQIIWSFRNKIVPPPNFDKDHYRGIGIIPTEEEMRSKNPVNYTVIKNRMSEKEKPKAKNPIKQVKDKKSLPKSRKN